MKGPAPEIPATLQKQMRALAEEARAAARALSFAETRRKDEALRAAAEALRRGEKAILHRALLAALEWHGHDLGAGTLAEKTDRVRQVLSRLSPTVRPVRRR